MCMYLMAWLWNTNIPENHIQFKEETDKFAIKLMDFSFPLAVIDQKIP